MKLTQKLWQVSLLSLALGLAACGDNDNDEVVVMPPPPPAPVVTRYEIQIDNLTEGQPLSPVTAILHTSGAWWEVGQPASVALEKLAESGDNQDLLAVDFMLASVTGDAPTLPGNSLTLSLSIEDQPSVNLSVLSMLGNTNDGFTGLNAVDLTNLAVGERLQFATYAYDAGTEANSESAATVPGPAAGGEGYNTERDDVRDMVLMHSGVVSADDGLATSALSQAQRFDNAVAKISITRTE